jgi:hypothetical protein
MINENGYYANKILKQYAKENGLLPRSTSDLSGLEEWLIMRLKITDVNLKTEINFINILLSLYKIYSKPGKEELMREFILSFYKDLDFEINFTQGNISVKRGKGVQVLLNAHLDSWMDDPKLFYDKLNLSDRIQAPGFMIGNDDKVGIAMILYLSKFTNLEFKALFTHSEEIGNIGIKSISNSYYLDCLMAITLDRRHGNDLISSYKGLKMISEDSIKYIESISHLKQTDGIFADTFYIAQNIPAFNMSVGYYGEHNKNDYVIISEALESLNFVKEFIEKKHYLKIGLAY